MLVLIDTFTASASVCCCCCCCCCCVSSVVSASVRPYRRQPTRLLCPWDSTGKNTGVGCHFLLQCMKVKVKSLSCVRLFTTPWTVAHQAPVFMRFSRQEYWSVLPLPSPLPLSTYTEFSDQKHIGRKHAHFIIWYNWCWTYDLSWLLSYCQNQ